LLLADGPMLFFFSLFFIFSVLEAAFLLENVQLLDRIPLFSLKTLVDIPSMFVCFFYMLSLFNKIIIKSTSPFNLIRRRKGRGQKMWGAKEKENREEYHIYIYIYIYILSILTFFNIL